MTQDPIQPSLFDSMTGADSSAGPNVVVPGGHEEETAIEVVSSNTLANFSANMELDADDILIPRLRLAQGLTAEVQDGAAKPGQWLLTGYDPAETLTCVPLMASRQRTLRDADDNGSILCKSMDGVTGVGDPGGVCAECPMNKWTEATEKGKKNTPPACTFSYVYIVYVEEFQSMALLEFRRTSLPAGKTLNTLVARRGMGKIAFKLRAAKQQGTRGTFYQIVVQPTEATEDLLANAAMFGGIV